MFLVLCYYKKLFSVQECVFALASVANLVGVLSHELKGRGFDSQLEHVPKLWFRSLVGVGTRGSQPILLSYFSAAFPLCPSLPFSLKAISTSLGEDKKVSFSSLHVPAHGDAKL